MEWNKENTVLLIGHFKEKRELWDSTSEHFKNRNRKHDAWMYLASKFDTEKCVVEKKMRSLIGQFQRELKKLRSRTGAEEMTSKWFGFELLLFLEDRNKVRFKNEAGISEDNPLEDRTSSKKKRKHDILKTQKETFDNWKAQNAYGIMETSQTEQNKSRDNFTVFGEYIACKLRNLQDPLTVSTVQNQIHNIIFQAEMNLYSGGGANSVGVMTSSYSGSANTIGSSSGNARTSFNRRNCTSSRLNRSSGPAASPHTDTDTSQFSEELDGIFINIKKSPSNDSNT